MTPPAASHGSAARPRHGALVLRAARRQDVDSRLLVANLLRSSGKLRSSESIQKSWTFPDADFIIPPPDPAGPALRVLCTRPAGRQGSCASLPKNRSTVGGSCSETDLFDIGAACRGVRVRRGPGHPAGR